MPVAYKRFSDISRVFLCINIIFQQKGHLSNTQEYCIITVGQHREIFFQFIDALPLWHSNLVSEVTVRLARGACICCGSILSML